MDNRFFGVFGGSGGGGISALTDGSGTTANGTAIDLGGALTSNAIITGATGTYSIALGQNSGTGYLSTISTHATQGLETYDSAFGGTFLGTSVTKNPAVHNIFNNISGNSVQHLVDGSKVQSQVLSGTITSELRASTQEALIKYNDNGVGSELNLSLLANIFTDNTSAQQGIVYGGDYSATFVGNSLVTRTWVEGNANGLYSGSGTVPTSVVATLTDTLTFNGGSGAIFKLYSTLRTDDIFQVFFNGGGEWKAKNGSIDIGAGTTYSNYFTRFYERGIKFYGSGVVVHEINNTTGNVYFMNDYMAGGTFTVGSNSPIGSEKISFQNSTLVSDKFEIQTTTAGFLMPRMTTAQMNAIAAPDTHLLIFNTDLNGIYRYDGAAWVALSTGYGIISINDSSGQPTFYADVSAAMAAASSGDTVKLHSNITETGNVTITIPSGVNFDLNGYAYTLDGSDNTAVQYTVGVGTRTKIINGTIIKKNSPTPLGGGNGLNIGSSPDLVDCSGLTVISDGAYCLNFNSAPDGSGFVKGGSFIYEGATSKAGGYAHIIDGRVDGAFFDTQDGTVRVTNAIFSNCKVDGAIATANTLSEVENCIVKNTNTFNAGISVQGAKVSNCYVYSQNTDAISSGNASSIISNCTAISDGSEGLNLNLGYAYNCYAKSTVTNGAWINQAGSAAYNCTIESSAAAAVRLRVGGRIYNSTAICTWNDVNGHAITVENSGVHEVIDCYCEVANASAYALTGNLSTIYSGLKGKGMTTLIGTTTQALINTEDAYGNILLS